MCVCVWVSVRHMQAGDRDGGRWTPRTGNTQLWTPSGGNQTWVLCKALKVLNHWAIPPVLSGKYFNKKPCLQRPHMNFVWTHIFLSIGYVSSSGIVGLVCVCRIGCLLETFVWVQGSNLAVQTCVASAFTHWAIFTFPQAVRTEISISFFRFLFLLVFWDRASCSPGWPSTMLQWLTMNSLSFSLYLPSVGLWVCQITPG